MTLYGSPLMNCEEAANPVKQVSFSESSQLHEGIKHQNKEEKREIENIKEHLKAMHVFSITKERE